MFYCKNKIFANKYKLILPSYSLPIIQFNYKLHSHKDFYLQALFLFLSFYFRRLFARLILCLKEPVALSIFF